MLNLSVGPRGLVWGVTWDGHCLVRLGVGKEKEVGAYWDMVFSPDDSDHKFLQVAVGTDIVWAVTRAGKVRGKSSGRHVIEDIYLSLGPSIGPFDELFFSFFSFG